MSSQKTLISVLLAVLERIWRSRDINADENDVDYRLGPQLIVTQIHSKGPATPPTKDTLKNYFAACGSRTSSISYKDKIVASGGME